MTKKRVPIQDVFAAAVPDQYDLQNGDTMKMMPFILEKQAIKQTWAQYTGYEKPAALEFNQIDWLITKEPSDVEKFQPAHDCPACRAGNDQALTFLRENPGKYIALANISYVEVWG